MSPRPCEHCGDEQWVEVVADGTPRLRRCQCFEERIKRNRQERINAVVPHKFRDVALARNPIARLPKSQQDKLRSYYNRLGGNLDAGRGLWLDGESGTGKSAAAALLAKRASDLGRSVLFCEVPELLNTLRRTYADETFIDDDALYRTVAEVDLLVLDDLGAPRVNDWVLEQLFIFINARYKSERAVVVTTDLPPDNLARQIGSRTVRRLRELCGTPLTLTFGEADTEAA